MTDGGDGTQLLEWGVRTKRPYQPCYGLIPFETEESDIFLTKFFRGNKEVFRTVNMFYDGKLVFQGPSTTGSTLGVHLVTEEEALARVKAGGSLYCLTRT